MVLDFVFTFKTENVRRALSGDLKCPPSLGVYC